MEKRILSMALEKPRQKRKRGLALILAGLMVLNISGISPMLAYAQGTAGTSQTINHLKITSQDGTFETAEENGGLITITSAGNYTLSMDGGGSSTTGILVKAPGGEVNLVLDGITVETANDCLKAIDTKRSWPQRFKVNIDLNGKASSLTYTGTDLDKYFGSAIYTDMTITDSGEGGSLAINGGFYVQGYNNENRASIHLKKGSITIDPKENSIGARRADNMGSLPFGDFFIEGADLIIPESIANLTYKVLMGTVSIGSGSFTWPTAELVNNQSQGCQLNLSGGTATVGNLNNSKHQISGGILNGEVLDATISGGRINGSVSDYTKIQPPYTEGDQVTINESSWNAQDSEKTDGNITLWLKNGSDQMVIVGEKSYEYKWEKLTSAFRLLGGKTVEITSDLSYDGVFPQGHIDLPTLRVGAEKTDLAQPTDIITYQWYQNKELIPLATESSFTVPITTAIGDYSYYCEVSCGGYAITSDLATVKIINGLASVEIGGNSRYCDNLQTAFLSVVWNEKATIKLLQDIDLGTVSLSKIPGEVTLDLNGKTLSGSNISGVMQETNNSQYPLTITGTGTIRHSRHGDDRVGAVSVARQLIIEENVTIISEVGSAIVCSSALGVLIKDNAQLKTNGDYPLIVVKGGGNISLDGGSLENTKTNKIIANTGGSVFINQSGVIQNNGSVEAANIYFNVADPSFSTKGQVWHKINSNEIEDSDKMTLSKWDNTTTKHEVFYGKKGQVITFTAKAKPGHIIYDLPSVTKGATPLSVTRLDEGDYITEENTCTVSFTMPDDEGVTLSVPVQVKSSLALVGEGISKVYDGTPVTLDMTKGNQLTWDSGGAAKLEGYYLMCGTQTTPQDAGSYYAKVSISEDNDSPAEIGYIPFAITKANSSIILEAQPKDKTYGQTITLKANVSGENQAVPMGTVVFKEGEIVLKDDAEVVGGVASFLWENYSLGDHNLTAEFISSASKNHHNALSQMLRFNVGKGKQQALKIIPVQGKKIGDAPFAISTSGGSGEGLVTYTVPINNGVLVIKDQTATIIGAGRVLVTATKAYDTNYTSATTTEEITISKGEVLSLVYPVASRLFYGQSLSEASLNGGSTMYGDFKWTDSSIVPVTINSGYEMSFIPSPETLENYDAITNPTEIVAVALDKSTPVVTLNARIVDSQESKQIELSAEVKPVGGGQIPRGTITFVTVTTGGEEEIPGAVELPLDNGKASYTWAGLADSSFQIKAIYSGNDDYNSSESSKFILDTSKEMQAPLTIDHIGEKTYGDESFTLSTTGGSTDGVVSFTSSDASVVSITGSTLSIHKAGTVTITASKPGNDQYNQVTQSASLMVNKKQVTIKAKDELGIITGSPMPEFDYIVSGLVGQDTFITPTLSTTAKGTNTIGDYLINISGGLLTNAEQYKVTYQSGKLRIIRSQADPGFMIDEIGTKTYGDKKFTLSTIGGKGSGMVSFTSSDESIVSITEEVATIHQAGTVVITASKAGDSTYEPATAFVQLLIDKKPVTIKADDKINVIAGTKMPDLTYEVSGLVEGDTFSDPVLLTTAPDINTIGNYDITISGGSLSNMASYSLTYVDARLTIINGIYPVTVIDGRGSGNYGDGSQVTITTSRLGYTFQGWSSPDGVTFADSTAMTTSFIMPNKPVTITANYTINASGDAIKIKGINNPIATDLASDKWWEGHYVYYGSYKKDPILWRVLDTTGIGGSSSVSGGMLLQAHHPIGPKAFSNQGKNWNTSEIRDWLRGDYLAEFTTPEKQAIKLSTANPGNSPVTDVTSVGLADDSIFLMDASDLGNNKYGYLLDFVENGINNSGNSSYIANPDSDEDRWWLRSQDINSGSGYAVHVRDQGRVYRQVAGTPQAIIPAFNLDLSSVFSTRQIPGKPDLHKLILWDEEMAIAVSTDNKLAISGDLVTVPYAIMGAHAANASHVRLMITDKAYTDNDAKTIYEEKWVVYSGDTAGSVSFTLPEGYLDTYKVYLMAEDVNGEFETDYVSFPLEINANENEKKSRVIFKSYYGQEMSNQLTASSGVTLPKGPTRYGYAFTGWSMTETQIQDAIERDVAEIIVQPVYDLIDETYTISAENGILKDTEGLETQNYKLNDVVMAIANPASEDKKFSHWSDSVPSILSYSTIYQFYASKDLALIANYVGKDEEINPVGTTQLINIETDSANAKLIFVSMATVPEGCKIRKAGVIATNDATVGNSGNGFNKEIATVRADSWTGNAYRFTWTKNVAVGDTWYVRSYLLYEDKGGNLVTVYGNMASQTY